MKSADTIVALSSGAPPSGVAVIRISGSAAAGLLAGLAGPLPPPRRLALRDIVIGGETIDSGLVAWFPAPHSFTGEDCGELQVHGSAAVVRALLRYLAGQPGVRLAEAGEFTRRAFEHGRLDLTAVEGLGDLIGAETEAQRRQAVARASGVLAQRVAAWRSTLLDMRAEIEARLDFSDEGDVGLALPPRVAAALDTLRAELGAALSELSHGRIVREGFRVALAGPPNAGKSSLLNALAKSDLAIVSDEPGTTRDIREVALDLGGQLVILVDMAGLRETTSRAEAEGVRRARLELDRADLVLWLVAPDVVDTPQPAFAAPAWRVGTKADRGSAPGVDASLSALTGVGVEPLLDRLRDAAGTAAAGPPPLLSRERDREAVAAALGALDAVDFAALELAAEDLRRASHALARLVGVIDAEAVLDRLFLSFCIGK